LRIGLTSLRRRDAIVSPTARERGWQSTAGLGQFSFADALVTGRREPRGDFYF
jgi:hypothetical protein